MILACLSTLTSCPLAILTKLKLGVSYSIGSGEVWQISSKNFLFMTFEHAPVSMSARRVNLLLNLTLA